MSESESFIVTATILGRVEGRREERIDKALEAEGIGRSHQDWNEVTGDDGKWYTRIDVAVDDRECATRLASALRCCGMVATAPVPLGQFQTAL
jgi:hypothetical protein